MNKSSHPYLLVIIGCVLAVLAGTAAIIAGPGAARDWWNFRQGFSILRYAAYAGVVSGVICIVSGFMAFMGGRKILLLLCAAGLVIGAIAFAVPMSLWQQVKSLPFIHDISTDTDNPPQFVDILPLRKSASNPAVYGGPEVAKLQHQFYPDIEPLILPIPYDAVFGRCLAAARTMGWQLVAENQKEGRIEAVATTKWFRFKDDIVIRIGSMGEQTRVDIRSVSRVGKSDVGANAARIRTFTKFLKEGSRDSTG